MLKRQVMAPGHRGLWLWVISACVAIPLAVGTIAGPHVMRSFSESKADIARITVKKYAFEAYPLWLADHDLERGCPPSLAALSQYMSGRDTRDPWGNDYIMWCDADSKRLTVMSLGADGIASWE